MTHCRILIKILEVQTDTLVLCVAAHDIGEYVRHYPRGKKFVCFFFCNLNIVFENRFKELLLIFLFGSSLQIVSGFLPLRVLKRIGP